MASAAPSHESDETQTLASSTSSIITVLQPDIIRTHILSRLDASTLAVASSVSSDLRHLCSDEDLWRKLCTATWPSLVDPIVSHVISTFPGGHHSFFSDAFPSIYHEAHHRHGEYPDPLPELIFTVDIYCQEKPLFSRVQRIETQSNMFLDRLFLVNALEPNVSVPTSVKLVSENNDGILKYLEENLTLSWIVIDPTRKRAANLSSWKPVSVGFFRHLVEEVTVLYEVVVEQQGPKGRWEGRLKVVTEQDAKLVRWVVMVGCVNVGGELHLNKVCMFMSALLMGRDAVKFLQCAMENGERKKVVNVKGRLRRE